MLCVCVLQLVSPIRQISMRGEVESTEPYVIKLTNTYDNDEVMQSQLNIDPERRSLLFTTNYDLGKRPVSYTHLTLPTTILV